MIDHGDGNKLMAWKFDQKESRKALAHMVIVDELPFSFVERQGWKLLLLKIKEFKKVILCGEWKLIL